MNISTGPPSNEARHSTDFQSCPMPGKGAEGQSDEQRLEQIVSWFSKQLNKQPGPADIYSLGSYMYHRGQFRDAYVLLKYYKSLPGHVAKEGDHLLAYAAWKLGCVPGCDEYEKIHYHVQIHRCLSNALQDETFERDWQLLVETSLDGIDKFMEEEIEVKEGTAAKGLK